MDTPNPNQAPSMSLPEPAPLQPQGIAPSAEAAPRPGEALPAAGPEMAAAPSSAPVSPADMSAPLPNSGVPQHAAGQATNNVATPMIADDADLIEKEWVVKAKQIVEKNRTDPYNQSRELNKFRASYMKKRYNKDIKIVEN